MLNQNLPINFACLIVLVGPPGSGKSTWAQNNAIGAVHVSQDDLIDAITPGGFDHRYRAVYRAAEDEIARAGLSEGNAVIVDRTNRTRAHRERWIRLARKHGCPVIALVMSTSTQMCRDRNAQRKGSRRVSDQRLERMFEAMEPVTEGEGFTALHLVSGLGTSISLAEILSFPEVHLPKEQFIDEYCHEAR